MDGIGTRLHDERTTLELTLDYIPLSVVSPKQNLTDSLNEKTKELMDITNCTDTSNSRKTIDNISIEGLSLRAPAVEERMVKLADNQKGPGR